MVNKILCSFQHKKTHTVRKNIYVHSFGFENNGKQPKSGILTRRNSIQRKNSYRHHVKHQSLFFLDEECENEIDALLFSGN